MAINITRTAINHTIYTKNNHQIIHIQKYWVGMIFMSPALLRVFMLNLTGRYERKFALCKQIKLKPDDVTSLMMIQPLL